MALKPCLEHTGRRTLIELEQRVQRAWGYRIQWPKVGVQQVKGCLGSANGTGASEGKAEASSGLVSFLGRRCSFLPTFARSPCFRAV